MAFDRCSIKDYLLTYLLNYRVGLVSDPLYSCRCRPTWVWPVN